MGWRADKTWVYNQQGEQQVVIQLWFDDRYITSFKPDEAREIIQVIKDAVSKEVES